jgi:hypothetical protein
MLGKDDRDAGGSEDEKKQRKYIEKTNLFSSNNVTGLRIASSYSLWKGR